MAATKTRYSKAYRAARKLVVRDATNCGRCGKPISDKVPRNHPNKATADHIIPRSQGGTDVPSNLLAVCGPCNSARGNKDWNWRPQPMVAGAEDW